ncbi:MAG: PspC domain-containing protein [Flavobacteriales bacterium]|jgi:phage shock protein PspC (stress-responsive transcriptional regulator)|nr:PspC domain-containing protein [Flavobacteriales bacterium]
MNKTININLGGIFFHIDEEAYDRLQHYLVLLKKSFMDTPGNEEIISDIENRIAELFTEKLTNTRQVVNNSDVDYVISVMGQPEEIYEEEDFTEKEAPRNNTHHQQKQEERSYKKKLFRDSEEQMIAGVASGLSYYLGIEVTITRLLFIFLNFISFGTPIIVYFILWIIVPEAVTSSDKLRMRGKPVNVSNIEKTVQDGIKKFNNEANKLGDKVRNADYESFGNNVKNSTSKAVNKGGSLLLGIIKVFLAIIGMIFIILASIAIVTSLIIFIFGGIFNMIDSFFFAEFDYNNTWGLPNWILLLGIFVLVIIPLILMLFAGIKMTFWNYKTKMSPWVIGLTTFWVIIGISSIFLLIQKEQTAQVETTIKEKHLIEQKLDDLLFITIKNDSLIVDYQNSTNDLLGMENDMIVKNIPLSISSSNDSIAFYEIKYLAKANNLSNAKKFANNIKLDYSIVDNTLFLSPYYYFPKSDKNRKQNIEFKIYLPNDKKVHFDESLKNLKYIELDNIKKQKIEQKLIGNTWKINKNTIMCTSCK